MNSEIQLIWQELQADLHTPAMLWQILVIVVSLGLAWSINGLLRAYVVRHARESWKIAIGGINRVLFPLSSQLFVSVGALLLQEWQHTSMLRLASTLLLAMAVIRLVVYALRYIFAPGSWLRTMEHAIAGLIWLILAFQMTGLTQDAIEVMESITFKIGKTQFDVWLVLQAVFIILVTLFVALWLSRMVENRLMASQHLNMNMRVVLTKVVRILFSLLAILMALSAVGLDITLLSVFGGALGVGLGFGLQKIASNYASGFIILLDESIHIGDIVTVQGHYGVVSELRSRYMVLRKLDNTEVIIPNETMVTDLVINHSMTDRKVRVQMAVQVSYETPLEQAMQLMLEAARTQERVLADPEPNVLLKGFADSGIDLLLNVWVADAENGTAALQSAIYMDMWHAFKKHNISIPFPQREVRVLNTAGAAASAIEDAHKEILEK
ncbi:mechanosensitive ion channel protein MscS [Pseudomethylobacillus aquaticus]|uniref:Mechanosensitive ion channel protein MscS n=1 Tax=Pseudomethylobacillus aquaticus TaxID=2676064 RepID=A0A3N0V2Z9_9PROT|nr:mechanosensitive ion channel domain-containing protein [Pseudomethylobacillus aquaticus]ROH87160.1 mechanosensitive ion channel protein MscS [Pseudomethylobacillus aquaticus]